LEAAVGSATSGTRQIPATILHKYIFKAHTRPNKIPVNVILKRKEGGTLLVTQLFDALRYKPEGRGFDSR
jgi:hypothetical protein